MTVGHGQGDPAYGRPNYGQPGYGQAGYGQADYRGTFRQPPGMRAADADREWTVSFLRAAYTEGRLSHELYDDRMGRALSAQTYGELDAVLTDLPRPAPPTPPPTNSMAIASLACGIGQAVLGPVPTIPAIVLGHMARRQIRQTRENGDGLALAGLILGWCGVVIFVLGVAAFFLVFTTFVHAVQTGNGFQTGTGPPPPPAVQVNGLLGGMARHATHR
jgi:hypothetical protein